MDKWLRRAFIFDKVLRHLGFNTVNVMQADDEVLKNVWTKSAADIIRDCQMETPEMTDFVDFWGMPTDDR